MKITKILTIAALAFAAHGVQAQMTNMEMPLASSPEPFSYVNKSEVNNNMEMPLASSPEPFAYSKEEVKSNISNLAQKFRENKVSEKKSLKF